MWWKCSLLNVVADRRTTFTALRKWRAVAVGKQLVDVPSFVVRTESEKHIELAPNSSLGSGPPGRVKRKKGKKGGGGGDDDE